MGFLKIPNWLRSWMPAGKPEQRVVKLLWLGLLGLVVIFVVAIVTVTIPMENRLKQAVDRNLQEAGYSRVVIRAAGRDVVLLGNVASSEAEQKAIAVTRAVTGVKRVASQLSFHPVRVSHIVLRRSEQGEISIVGEVSDQAHVIALGNRFPQDYSKFASTISINPEVSEPKNLALIGHAESVSNGVEQLKIELDATQMIYSGVTTGLAKYLMVIQAVEEICKESGLKLVNQLATVSKKS